MTKTVTRCVMLRGRWDASAPLLTRRAAFPLAAADGLGCSPCRMSTLNFAIVGTGGITLQNHLPGLAMCPDVKVMAVCDTSPATLEAARQQTGAAVSSTNFEEIVNRDDVQAVIIATPN